MTPLIDQMGGEETVHLLVDHFYDLIETLPQGHAIMEMHLKGHGLSCPMSAPRSSNSSAASSAGGAITTNATAI